MKTILSFYSLGLMGIVLFFTGCGAKNIAGGEITVISREEGSGTRGAFIELFGIEQINSGGIKEDFTAGSADITNSTSVVITSVAQNRRAIGYISLGSLNESVKALSINGIPAATDNIINGTYVVSRPFNIITKDGLSPLALDFINYILSREGQAVVKKASYVPLPDPEIYRGGKPSGKILISGSSSVAPVMEKLKEAYLAVNGNAAIEIQQSDSTMGIINTINGICDIGMASRELKESERVKGIKNKIIALDGIVVIVNPENPAANMTVEQVRDIYTGRVTKWGGTR
ncbi:MAG: substrate-binding domain-containing protein [Treponema sp.]|jgi:phosphate transport system substrate-binding protein|nr:substrate-binding domain-containing protein [Treponema sp.]